MEIGALLGSEVVSKGLMPHILLPGERTKNSLEHMVPLTDALAFELKDAAAYREANPLPADDPDADLLFRLKPTSGWAKLKARLDERMLFWAREEAKNLGRDPDRVTIPNWTIHDLRRTAATNIAELGVEPHVIDALLNQVTGKVSGVARTHNRYQYFREKKDALERWEQFIIHHCEGPGEATEAA